MAKVFHICQEIGGRITPVNGECDNFNYLTGCLGHDQPDIMEHEQATNEAGVFTDNQLIDIKTRDSLKHNNATNLANEISDEPPLFFSPCLKKCSAFYIINGACKCYEHFNQTI